MLFCRGLRDEALLIYFVVLQYRLHHGLDEGNPDLSTHHANASDFVGVQPGIGDSIDRYHGLDDGNSDLFKADNSVRTDSGDDPDIYTDVSRSPDLHF